MSGIGLVALITAVILLAYCVALAWRQQRRLAAMQTQLDGLSSAIRNLEVAQEGLLVRFMNLPRRRKAQNSSKKMPAPAQPDEKNSKGSALYVVAPKTSPE